MSLSELPAVIRCGIAPRDQRGVINKPKAEDLAVRLLKAFEELANEEEKE
jgi:hypothetical protein